MFIFGSGGHGRVVLDILMEGGGGIDGFIDEDEKKIGQIISGFPVLGNWSFLKRQKLCLLTLGIGNNKIRERIFKQAKRMKIALITAIHPKAIVAKDVRIGEGVVIMPGAVINSGSVIEDGVVVNTGATVDHDCYLSRFCQVWPGAHLAGAVKIGEFSYVGTGASVIQNINIGRCVMIGAGATVISDIPDGVTAVGVPAKVIRRDKNEKQMQ